MKYFVVVILAAICGSALCGKAELEETMKVCSAKHNLKAEDMKDAIHGKIDATPEMKCFTLCVGERQKLIKDGAFQPQVASEVLASSIDKDRLAKIVSECNLKGSDDCDTAFKVISCIVKYKMQ